MKTPRVTRRWALALATISLAMIACHGDSPVAPTERTAAPRKELAGRSVCASECVLATGAMFLRAAAERPDSTTPLTVGDFRVRGAPGATVAVRLEATGELARLVGQGGMLLVSVDGGPPQRVAFESMLEPGGATVYRFMAAREVGLHYAVVRNLTVPQNGTFRLVQRLSAQPWSRARRRGESRWRVPHSRRERAAVVRLTHRARRAAWTTRSAPTSRTAVEGSRTRRAVAPQVPLP